MSDGWKYVDGEPVWRPGVGLAMAEITSGRYGEEYDHLQGQLDDLVAAVRREAAQEIRENIGTADYPNESERVRGLVSMCRAMADLIDPDKSEG